MPSPHSRRLALRFGLTRIAVGVGGAALVWWVHPHLAPSAPAAPKVLFIAACAVAAALGAGPYRRWVRRTEARLEAEDAVAPGERVPPAA